MTFSAVANKLISCATLHVGLQVPETAKEVSDHLNEAARTVGERAVPAADDMSANIMGHAKNFEEALPAAADDVSANLRETAKAAGEQAKIGAHEVCFIMLINRPSCPKILMQSQPGALEHLALHACAVRAYMDNTFVQCYT